MHKQEFTHYGWFGLCPAIFSEIESGCPYIESRWLFLSWFMTLNEIMIDLYLNFRCKIDDDFDPMYPLVISGEFKKPKVVVIK